MLQAGIETRVTLRQSHILSASVIVILSVSEGIFYVYLSTYTLLATWSAQF